MDISRGFFIYLPGTIRYKNDRISFKGMIDGWDLQISGVGGNNALPKRLCQSQ